MNEVSAADLLVDEPAEPKPADEIALAIAAGAISSDPTAAYRLGKEHGHQEILATPSGRCWACHRPAIPPSPEEQTRMLADMHYRRTSPWHWHPEEFRAARELLESQPPGSFFEPIVYGNPMYGTLRIVLPDGSKLQVLRHELMNRAGLK